MGYFYHVVSKKSELQNMGREFILLIENMRLGKLILWLFWGNLISKLLKTITRRTQLTMSTVVLDHNYGDIKDIN